MAKQANSEGEVNFKISINFLIIIKLLVIGTKNLVAVVPG